MTTAPLDYPNGFHLAIILEADKSLLFLDQIGN